MLNGKPLRILIVDDEKKICDILKEILEHEGYEVSTALNGGDATRVVETDDIHLVLLDIKLPDTDGLSLLKHFSKIRPEIPVIMISAFGTVPIAVQALKNGAQDFVEKPLEVHRVLTTIRNTLEKVELRRQSMLLKSRMLEQHRIIGNAPTIRQTLQLVDRIAPTDSTVLILGETGTGKDLVAHNIHLRSHRSALPLVKVNCAALPGELIESELFGYEKGAFTGAYSRKPGRFEIANYSTLFLDEIGDMSLPAQSKVLRAIEEHEIMHLGGTKVIKINVRLIVATNQDLEELIKTRRFREDLYHRVNVIKIELAPLRERKGDIPMLADHFLKKACIDNNRPIKGLSAKALRLLTRHDWPGNIRELKHLMERVSILVENKIIEAADLEGTLSLVSEPRPGTEGSNIDRAKRDLERKLIVTTLEASSGQMAKAAKSLGIDRTTLFRKMRRLGIRKRLT
jgi:two-component system nitrogen regulation response regulator NtrX